jgi:hypothetical protein
MNTTTVAVDVAMRNAPPVTVVGMDWFMNFPVDTALKWATLVWIVIQAGFYLRDKLRSK